MLWGSLMCGHNTGTSNAISPVKQPEQKAVVMARCIPLPFDKKDNEKQRKAGFSLQYVPYVKLMFFCLFFLNMAFVKSNCQWDIREVEVVRLEPSCGWLLERTSFPLSVWRVKALGTVTEQLLLPPPGPNRERSLSRMLNCVITRINLSCLRTCPSPFCLRKPSALWAAQVQVWPFPAEWNSL